MSKVIISTLGFDDGKSGISAYIKHVVNLISKDNEVTIIVMKSEVKYFKENLNLKHIVIPSFLRKPAVNMLFHTFILPIIIKWSQYDLVLLPAGNRRLFFKYPKNTIVTFHDLSQFYIPNKYDRLRMFYIKKLVPMLVQKAPKIISVSHNTKKDLVKFYDIDPEKITVKHIGADIKSFKAESTPELMKKLPQNYYFYVARLEHPGKNHHSLIKAYAKIKHSLRNKYKLVLAGADWGGEKILKQLAKELGVQNDIVFLGHIDNKELTNCYLNSSFFIFPSLYEGFGIPLLEAMSFGLPCLSSNVSSLPEIGGDAAIYFSPQSPDEICAAMTKVIESPDLSEDLKKKSLIQSKKFSWQSHVDEIISIAKL